MLLIGHRGCKYPGYNQNTIRAFEKVSAEGIPAIEFDVQRCGDDHLVVVHNLDLEEVSTGKGEVSNTASTALKKLYAGDPACGKDRIPFLPEVLDFFAAQPPAKRPAIHMELKGANTGEPAGELFSRYVAAGKLEHSDLFASSFSRKELKALRKICPEAKIALLDGAIRRKRLLEKTGEEGEQFFGKLFVYGNEEYMLPRFADLDGNLRLLDNQCGDPNIKQIIAEEIEACLNGQYYTDELLEHACAMNAVSVNLWHRTVTTEFITKVHSRGLALFVFTVNNHHEVKKLASMGVDGIFTDFYSEAAKILSLP